MLTAGTIREHAALQRLQLACELAFHCVLAIVPTSCSHCVVEHGMQTVSSVVRCAAGLAWPTNAAT